ncbi:MAG: hypothetical protein GXO86_05060 [Chlorobi bacterium]|nr:hypothetical protein [Chlorobiota bacterium]
MKKSKYIKYLFIILFQFFALVSIGQMLEPDDPGNDPVGEDPLGGGAPVSGGTALLILLGTVYGAKKVYELKKEDLPE